MEILSTQISGYTDGELLALRVETVRKLTSLTDLIGLIDGERAERAPQDQQAEIIPLIRSGHAEKIQ